MALAAALNMPIGVPLLILPRLMHIYYVITGKLLLLEYRRVLKTTRRYTTIHQWRQIYRDDPCLLVPEAWYTGVHTYTHVQH